MDKFVEEAMEVGFSQAQADFLHKWFLSEDEEEEDDFDEEDED